MKIAQTKLREIILQFLYSWEVKTFDDNDLIPLIMEMVQVSKRNAMIGKEKGEKVLQKIFELDEKIKSASTEYQLERISTVDHLILRLTIYEMLYENLPVPITIHEAVRLSNKFSTPGASAYVHAILDTVNRNVATCGQALI